MIRYPNEGDSAEGGSAADGAHAFAEPEPCRISGLQAAATLSHNGGLAPVPFRNLAPVASVWPASAAVLTRNAGFDEGRLGRKLRSLVERGLVRTAPDPDDHWAQVLPLDRRGTEAPARRARVGRGRAADPRNPDPGRTRRAARLPGPASRLAGLPGGR